MSHPKRWFRRLRLRGPLPLVAWMYGSLVVAFLTAWLTSLAFTFGSRSFPEHLKRIVDNEAGHCADASTCLGKLQREVAMPIRILDRRTNAVLAETMSRNANAASRPWMDVPTRRGHFASDWVLQMGLRRPPPRESRFLLILALAIGNALFVMSLAAFFLSRRLKRALSQLENVANSVARGDFTVRSDLHRDGTFGGVARAFDSMVNETRSLFDAENEMLAGVSHELRTPLARMRMRLELASSDVDSFSDAISGCTADLHELDEILREILQGARAQINRRDVGGLVWIAKRKVHLHELLKKASVDLKSNYSSDLSMQIDLPEDTFLVGSPVLLLRVLSNVLENACLHGSLQILLHAFQDTETNELNIVVRDFGQGIASEQIERLFRAFERDNDDAPGMGLGLALTKRIVEAHGGSIAIESSVKGTNVTLRLPMLSASSEMNFSELPPPN